MVILPDLWDSKNTVFIYKYRKTQFLGEEPPLPENVEFRYIFKQMYLFNSGPTYSHINICTYYLGPEEYIVYH